METIRIRTTQNVDVEYEVAGLGDRILARLIDYVIAIAAFVFIGLVFTFAGRAMMDGLDIALFVITVAVAFVFYDLICELTMNGQSVGKRLMKIRVISLDGSRPSLGQYLMRWVMRIVDFTLTSWLCATIAVAVSEKKQRIGDMVANTTLIKTQPKTQPTDFNEVVIQDEYVPVFAEATQLTDQDINLIYDVMKAYHSNGNVDLITSLAGKIKGRLHIDTRLDDFNFLKTIVKDYQNQTSGVY